MLCITAQTSLSDLPINQQCHSSGVVQYVLHFQLFCIKTCLKLQWLCLMRGIFYREFFNNRYKDHQRKCWVYVYFVLTDSIQLYDLYVYSDSEDFLEDMTSTWLPRMNCLVIGPGLGSDELLRRHVKVSLLTKYVGPYSRKRTHFSPGLNLD